MAARHSILGDQITACSQHVLAWDIQKHTRCRLSTLSTLTDKPDTAICCFAKSQFREVCDIAAGVDFVWRAELPEVQLLAVRDNT